ncbi:hypothetical protein ACHQM5_001202 [Ranunculus cassubicifolius]
MKLVWCPDSASKSYIDAVKSCEALEESEVAELVSAMAGGWKPQLIVETWYQHETITTSVGLAASSRHTSARHVCIVPDEGTQSEYAQEMGKFCNIIPEIHVGDVSQIMEELAGIDFLVVDCRRKDSAKVLRLANLSHRGAVLVCKNSSSRNFRWRNVIGSGSRIMRSASLPVGNGVEIAHVATARGCSSSGKGTNKWVRHIDHESGEEHVYRK